MRAGSASSLGTALPLGSEKLQAMGTGGFGASAEGVGPWELEGWGSTASRAASPS